MAVHFIVDDQNPDIEYLCSVTKETVSGAYFNKTWTTTADDLCQDEWFRYNFYGTGVEIVTFSPSLQNYSVKIDESLWVIEKQYGGFHSPLLADGLHTLSCAAGTLETPAFDYLVVEAGFSTPLENRTIIVDDTDPGLVYSGNWITTEVLPFISLDKSTAPYQKTNHWSTSSGDAFQYRFSGSSVAIFGSFANFTAGHNFSATYNLDGVSTVGYLPDGAIDALPMHCLFSTNSISPGNHTLSVTITHISPPLAVAFDFLTFNASFEGLATMPSFMTPLALSDKKHLTGAIAGGILGGVALIIAAFLIFLMRRRAGQWTRMRHSRQVWQELK